MTRTAAAAPNMRLVAVGLVLAASIVAIILVVTAPAPIEGGPQACLDALDTFSAELERAFRDRPALSSVDLAEEPVLQAASRGIVSACSPWIRETTINGSGWG